MRIRNAALALGVSSDWLRRIERANVITRVPRDRNGHRRYAQEDLDRIRRFLLTGEPKVPGEFGFAAPEGPSLRGVLTGRPLARSEQAAAAMKGQTDEEAEQ